MKVDMFGGCVVIGKKWCVRMTNMDRGFVYAVYNVRDVSFFASMLKMLGTKDPIVVVDVTPESEKMIFELYENDVKRREIALCLAFVGNRVPQMYRAITDVFFDMNGE